MVKDGWGFKSGSDTGINASLGVILTEMDNGQLDVIGEFTSSVYDLRNRMLMIAGSIVNSYIGPEKTVFAWVPKYRVSVGNSFGDSFCGGNCFVAGL